VRALDQDQIPGIPGNAAREGWRVLTDRPVKIMFGEMRESGVRSMIISCASRR